MQCVSFSTNEYQEPTVKCGLHAMQRTQSPLAATERVIHVKSLSDKPVVVLTQLIIDYDLLIRELTPVEKHHSNPTDLSHISNVLPQFFGKVIVWRQMGVTRSCWSYSSTQ